MKDVGSIDQGFDFINCKNTEALVQNSVRGELETCIHNAGFTLIDSIFHKFEEGGEGYSFIAIIGESHVAVHSWPEKRAVEITLHYCNFSQDNSDKAEKLIELYKELFQPERVDAHEIRARCPRSAYERQNQTR